MRSILLSVVTLFVLSSPAWAQLQEGTTIIAGQSGFSLYQLLEERFAAVQAGESVVPEDYGSGGVELIEKTPGLLVYKWQGEDNNRSRILACRKVSTNNAICEVYTPWRSVQHGDTYFIHQVHGTLLFALAHGYNPVNLQEVSDENPAVIRVGTVRFICFQSEQTISGPGAPNICQEGQLAVPIQHVINQ